MHDPVHLQGDQKGRYSELKINRNTLGHLDEPQFILCKASEERIGVLKCTSKKWTHNYNDMDTLSFEVPYKADGKNTPFYDEIDIMKYVLVPQIGLFSIKDVEINNEGEETEFKSVQCQDYSCQLGTKYLVDFTINTGTTGAIDNVSLYDPGNQQQSLLNLILEKLPEWKLGHIDPALRTMHRSFEVTRQDVYSFLMSEIMNAFECIVTFDTINKTINLYQEENYGIDTNISISYNNLLEKSSLSLSLDEIKTCLTLSGESDLSVREVNMGFDSIYDFSAFASETYWSTSLLDAYHAWTTLVNQTINPNEFTYKDGVITRADLKGKSYKDAYTVLLAKYQAYYTDISKWESTLIPFGINTRNQPGYGTISYTEDGHDQMTFDRQASTVLVDSLPVTGDATVLYLIKPTGAEEAYTWDMFRWNGQWVNVNRWYNCCLASLKEKLASAENIQAVAMKAGYGNPGDAPVSWVPDDPTKKARYIDSYLPAYYMGCAITKQIEVVNETLNSLNEDQEIIQTDKSVIINKTSMKNNFTEAQLKELSTFIREEELSTDNYLVTDVMTEEERFEMLYDFLEYGQKELAKVATPQLQFSCDLVNLFAIPEFDVYSGDFDLGNYVWVTLRDDYSIKAKLLSITLDFLDQSQFSVTFGNIAKKAKNIFTDVTDALNAATAAATSVSFNSSYWSASAEETDSIGQALQAGLLSQSYYLANAEDNETLIDENGLWITTTTGIHGRDNTDDYDAIYIGGGRMLFTDDGWRNVSMSVGRADVDMPTISTSGTISEIGFVRTSLFGTFGDFVIAGYVAGSTIVGGDLYSPNYKTNRADRNSGNRGSHLDLTNGVFEFNNDGKKRLTLNGDGVLEVNGIIQASSGHIGSDDNGEGGFIIEYEKMYNGKSSMGDDSRGVYVGIDGIALGAGNTFSVTEAGYLHAISGDIGGSIIEEYSIHASDDRWTINSDGSAAFKRITISDWASINGVQLGSQFGSLKYMNKNGIPLTQGTFKGDSYYDSDQTEPFSGGCKTHIEYLALKKLEAEWIEAGYIKTSLLNADNIQTGEIDGTRVVINNARLHGSWTSINGNIVWNNHTLGSDWIDGVHVVTITDD